jgi:S1-C subfamily serine protease
MTESSTSGLLAGISDELAAAVERAGRSIVQINARRRQSATGIVWGEPNLVVTADHVIEREEDITVGLPDGKESPAKLVGREPSTDLALLRIEGTAGTPAEAGAAPKVGNLVLAVGRPAPGQPQATLGVVSALGEAWRTRGRSMLEGYIRADVVMYPGFSGGPLVDAAGRVLGLNTSGLGGQMGITIPAATVTRVVDLLKAGGKLKRAFLGFSSQPVAIPKPLADKHNLSQESGLMVMAVEDNSPAAQGGLIVGDIVVALGDQPVRDVEDLQLQLTGDKIGQPTPLRVIRGGEATPLTVTPGERA